MLKFPPTVLLFVTVMFICQADPRQDLNFKANMDESDDHSLNTIRDYFTISVSPDSPVALFDRAANKIAGKLVEARINDFRNYQLCLTDTSLPFESDSAVITFSRDDFVRNYTAYIRSSCPPPKDFTLWDIRARIGDGKGVLYPDDTVDVHIFYVDKDGKEHKFNKDAVFEAGLISGCGSAKILSSDGELKGYFSEIREPIRLVMATFMEMDWDDAALSFVIGCHRRTF